MMSTTGQRAGALTRIGGVLSVDLDLPTPAHASLLLLASLLLTGCGVFCDNHAIQISLVHWLNNPSLYPHDPYAAALASYPSPLWIVVAWLARLAPLEPLLLVLLVLERLLVLYAAARLARTFAPGSKLAAIGAMALFAFAMNPLLGGGTIVEYYFEQTGLAVAFFLLAASSFYDHRPVSWAVFTAIGFNLTSLYGIFALTYFAAAFLLDPAYRRAWRDWALPLLLFFGLSSYSIFLGLSAVGRDSVDEKLWILASHVRCWQHLYMRAWNTTHFLEFGVLASFFLAVLCFDRARMHKLFRHGLIWCVVVLSWLLFAHAAAYLLESRPLLMMQPARASDLWVCFAAVAAVSICAARIEQAAGSWERRFMMIVFAGSFLLWRPTGSYVATAFVIALALPPLWRRLLLNGSARRLALLLTVWACFAGVRSFRDRLAETKSVAEALITRPEAPVRQVAAWACASTPPDAAFLVNVGSDPDWEQFRALSQRSIFTNWDEGTAINWHPSFVTEWTERLRMVGFDIAKRTLRPDQELDALYRTLRDADVESIRGRVPLRYWVVPTEHSSRFPVAFQVQGYKVLDLTRIINMDR